MLRGVIVFVALFALTAPLAAGHPSPPDCTASAVHFQLNSPFPIKRNGDVVSVVAGIGNDNSAGACDITDATVTLSFPAPDGSADGRIVTLGSGLDFPGGAAVTTFPAKKYMVEFDTGVFRGPVKVSIEGTQHFPGGDTTGSIGSMASPLVISRPHVTFGVGAVASVSSPFTVTYTYSAENDSPSDPAGEVNNPTPEVIGVEVADDNCSPVTFTGGDTTDTDPPLLQKGETWTYECTRSLPAGSLVNIAVFTGTSTRDGRAWPKRTVRHAWCGRLPATIVGTKKADTIEGTPHKDVIVARGGDDVVDGRGGGDLICGGDGNDTLRGKGGDDVLRGEAGADKLVGGSGVDRLLGGPGHDSLIQ
jgi:hemolysin type calcium-binding protein